jgi:hypothetical protein
MDFVFLKAMDNVSRLSRPGESCGVATDQQEENAQ